MSLSKRGSSWQATKTIDGKRTRRSFPTASAAEAWLAEVPAPPKPTLMTIHDALELTSASRWLGTKGEQTAIIAAQACVDTLGADYPMADVDEGTVDDLIGAWRKAEYSPATINRRLAGFSALCETAVKRKALDKAPEITRLKEGPGRTRVFTKSEQEEFLNELRRVTEDVPLIVELLFETGMRVSELLTALRSSSFTFDPAAFTVRDSKSGRSRTIPMTARAKQVAIVANGWMHSYWADESSFYDRVLTFWNKAKASLPWAANDPEIVPHCARHTCATRLLQAGVPIRTVQEWLGHKTLAMTMRYTHLVPGALEAAAKALEGGG